MFKVFDLIGVSRSEKAAMEKALQIAKIPFYETPKANWGSGQPAIWVKSEKLVPKAQEVIRTAQEHWQVSSGARRDRSGSEHLVRNPIFWLVIVAVAANLIWAFFTPGVR